jgi:hypothetical protein
MLARLGVSGCAGGYEGKAQAGTSAGPKIWRRAHRYCYCCGLTVPLQVAIAVMLKRTTASSYEQK